LLLKTIGYVSAAGLFTGEHLYNIKTTGKLLSFEGFYRWFLYILMHHSPGINEYCRQMG